MNNTIKGPTSKEANYCKKGHDDDKIVRTLLSRDLINDIIIHTVDVDYDSFFRSLDIDLILYNKDNKMATAEIKADAFPVMKDGKKYIFCELVSNSKKFEESKGKTGQGCILTSKSDYFIFYFILYDSYLVIKSNILRDYILNNKEKYDEKKARTWSPDNKKIWYYSIGRVVPIDDILKIGGTYVESRYKYEDIKKELNI